MRKRDVTNNDDADMTREPEMVQAYRDTWRLGLHSYLTYLRDRLLVARDLLTPSGSVFVQISDENLHHVREVMDEVFGPECSVVTFVAKKKGSQKSSVVDPVNDYLLWYGRSQRATGVLKFRALFERREFNAETLDEFRLAEMPNGATMNLARGQVPDGSIVDYRADPGDLVLDPTCGSGTSAYAAEQWGRRWITIDSSRVPLTLTRQRLLTATFPWYELREESAGPSNGFVYSRRQNRREEEIGGIVPHVSLNTIANDEPPGEKVLVDRPDVDGAITRISGPFVVEATLPTPQQLGDGPTSTTPKTDPATTSRE